MPIFQLLIIISLSLIIFFLMYLTYLFRKMISLQDKLNNNFQKDENRSPNKAMRSEDLEKLKTEYMRNMK